MIGSSIPNMIQHIGPTVVKFSHKICRLSTSELKRLVVQNAAVLKAIDNVKENRQNLLNLIQRFKLY